MRDVRCQVKLVEWLGVGFMAAAAAVLPFAYWIARWWGLVALILGCIGAIFLAVAWRRRRVELGDSDPNADLPPAPLGKELRGFPGARVFEQGTHHDPDT